VVLGPEQDGFRPVDGLSVGALVVDEGKDLVGDGTRLRVVATAPALPPVSGGK
jgi:hypothetical protein